MSIEMAISALVAFVATYVATRYSVRYFRFVGLVTADVHKKGNPKVPYSAGIPLMMGLSIGLMFYIFLNVFLLGETQLLTTMFAAICSIFIISFVGLLDDMNSAQVRVRGHIEGKRGLKRWQKPLLTLIAALPLMAIMAGTTDIYLPLVGSVDFGMLYPFFVVPAAILIASNAVNMLGGFNGLEAGMGVVYTLSLGIFAWLNGLEASAVLFFTTFAGLLAVMRFNFVPARILSGDSLTYLLGAVIAVGAIVGNMEKAAILTGIPFIVQAALKFYSHRRLGVFASDLGVLQKDGSIKSKYGPSVYSWTHLMMRFGRLSEKQIVIMMMVIQAFFSALPFLGIF